MVKCQIRTPKSLPFFHVGEKLCWWGWLLFPLGIVWKVQFKTASGSAVFIPVKGHSCA